eukprot:scaffold8828_cov204-Amphora_coffeaeformis.AAC.5
MTADNITVSRPCIPEIGRACGRTAMWWQISRKDSRRGKDAKNAGFEDTGGELQVWQWRQSSSEVAAAGAPVATAARFSSILWTPFTLEGRAPAGCIIGGMLDGSIVVWNALELLQQNEHDNNIGDSASTSTSTSATPTLFHFPLQNNHGPVGCLAWNPLEPWNIAVGTSHGQAYLIDLSDASPAIHAMNRHPSEVTAVAWNSQVPHICATASNNDVTVWDTKAGKPWSELRTQSTADLQWNPRQGLHLLTADGPVVNVWDLAASTTLPVAQLAIQQGATLLKMDWCPHDETLLITSAKDGKAYIWDLQTMQPLAELPNDGVQQPLLNNANGKNPAALFAASSTPTHVRYEILWSPHHRGVLLTCRLDKHVQWQAMPALPRPPAWQTPRCCRAAQGFGATLATVDNTTRTVTLSVVPQNIQLATVAAETASQGTDPRDVCLHQQAAKPPREAAMWGFLSVLFEANARQALLEYLGFSAQEIQQAVAEFQAPDDNTETVVSKAPADDLVQQALTVGDFTAAVDACFKVHNYADALLLASCGGGELWASTQQRYLQASARPYVPTVQAILQSNMAELVEMADLTQWQQTLALLSTYGTSNEFPQLCKALGQRIQDAGDHATASLCFICAMDFEAVVTYWKAEMMSDAGDGANGDNFDVDSIDWRLLHDFCTQVSILQQACPHAALPQDAAQLFTQYAKLLADEGLLAAAAAYAKDGILQDRLYRSRSSPACLAAMQNQPPAFPFQMQQVDACRGVVNMAEQRQAAEQARIAAEQQAEYQRQQAEYQKQAEYQRQQREAQQAAQAEQRAQQQAAQLAQQQQQQQQSNGFSHQAPAPAVLGGLPDGWMELQDPSSGRPYYYNQTTQETTWERPAPVAAPVPAPVPTPPPHQKQQLQQQQMPEITQTPSSAKKRTVASKYGDGFVSSASDPKLAYQYGNVGTSNPYHGAERPGTAAAAVGGSGQAPISETFNVDNLELSADLVPLRDSLLQMVDSLNSLPLGAADKRQMTDGEKAVAVFIKKLAIQAIHDESLEQAKTMVSSLVARDFRTATAMQTALVNNEWREHKDWLKGFKSLIQLASRKLAHPHPIQY